MTINNYKIFSILSTLSRMSDMNLNALTSKMASLKVSKGVTKKKTKAKNIRSIKQRIRNLKSQLATTRLQLVNTRKSLSKKSTTAAPSKERVNELIAMYTKK